MVFIDTWEPQNPGVATIPGTCAFACVAKVAAAGVVCHVIFFGGKPLSSLCALASANLAHGTIA